LNTTWFLLDPSNGFTPDIAISLHGERLEKLEASCSKLQFECLKILLLSAGRNIPFRRKAGRLLSGFWQRIPVFASLSYAAFTLLGSVLPEEFREVAEWKATRNEFQ